MPTKPHYAKAETIEELAANFAEVENRIRAACRRAGRPEQSVRLLPVTKTVDERRLRMAYEQEGATVVRVGQAVFGTRALPDSHYWPEEKRPD